MKFLARDPVPIFLGDAGAGHNYGGTAAQLGKFDVYYRLPPPIALDAECPADSDGTAVLALEVTETFANMFFVPGEIPSADVAYFATTAPEPDISLFDVVYDEERP